VAGLEGYREHFPRAFAAPEVFPEDAAGIVALLNKWACRLSTEKAPGALDAWLREHPLDKFAPLTITNTDLPTEELGALHDDLIRHMQAGGVKNMGPAAASKTLYVLQPRLFVMWDKEIRRSALESYGSYLQEMHALAVRLSDEAPTDDVEAYLQEHLGSEKRKTLAKYLDEYNWFEAVGREQLTARRDRSRGAPG
jgi:hypothetical protein